ncbi:MAG: hypothetical protein OEV85_13810 [Candidatus Thorarchaeota archaeon]|nr:hypothetical protein [Candidatus Thorarchaeota archaeon]
MREKMKIYRALFEKKSDSTIDNLQGVVIELIEYQGNGSSPDDPVIITGVSSETEGLSAERKYLHRKYGDSHEYWKISTMEIIVHGKNHLNKVIIEMKNGKKEEVFFLVKL